MGIISRSLGVQALSMEDPAQPLLPPGALYESLGLGRSDAGVLVNERQAMRITTAQACIRIISEDLATNAHEIFQQMPNGGMRPATDHRLWGLLHDEPHPHMSAAVFWGALGASSVGWGNGYAWINRDRAARVISLVPLKSGITSPVKTRAGELLYATTQTETGAVAYIDPANILHVPGLTFDGYVGISPIQECKNAFGLALAAEKFGAQFFGNGARATGVLSHPGQLETEAYENLKKSVREWATGESALRPIILEEGMKWEQVTVAPNDAQFIATRQFQRSEIAALYRMAMHLLQDLSRATNNNIEHQSLDHVRYCLRPWAVRIEQEVNRKLLGKGFVMEHNFKDMQRGDFASQAAGIQILRNIGYYSNNDIARALRENPIPASEGGDVRTVQGAMIPLTALLNPADENAQSSETDSSQTQPFNRISVAYRRLFRDAVGRTINRAGDPEFTRRAFQPVVSSMAQAMLAMRFGSCDLTKKELGLIEAQTNLIATAAPAWAAKDASAISTRLTEQVYSALSGEILE
jgi:HK97 family phage portal protein